MNDLWQPRRRIEKNYRNALMRAMRKLHGYIDSLHDPVEILKRMKQFSISKAFSDYAQMEAMRMVTHLFTDAGRTWRQAAKKNSKGRIIFEALKKEMRGPIGGDIRFQIERNAELIKSLPGDIAKHVNEHILSESMKGTRASDIADQIKSYFPHEVKTRANLIARTEVGKTSTALTEARSRHMGVNWYVWNTSEDQRVRKSHRLMDKVLVNWNDPPSPEALAHEKSYGHYQAAGIWNCRCFPAPIIDLDTIQWPARVYYRGSIQRMSRKQFEKIM